MGLVELLVGFVDATLPVLIFALVCIAIDGVRRLGRWLHAHRAGIRWSLIRGRRGDVYVTPRPTLPDVGDEEPVDARVIRELRR